MRWSTDVLIAVIKVRASKAVVATVAIRQEAFNQATYWWNWTTKASANR
jgi:hypothetical protein